MKRGNQLVATAISVFAVLASSGAVLADGHGPGGDGEGYVCTGGAIPTGNYSSMEVTGVCSIPAGSVTVSGDLVIRPGALLDAVSPAATVVVGRNLRVERGAVLFLGCGASLPICSNTSPGPDRVGGSIEAAQALGVVIHAVTVGGNLSIIGGGGGPSIAMVGSPGACFRVPAPSPWSQDPNFSTLPVYSDVEDTSIGGDLRIVGLQTCWLGALRNQVGGNLIDVHNQMGDPDANEVLANTVGHNLACFANTPAVHVGDSLAGPNQVSGRALGECASSSIATLVPGGNGSERD